MKERLKTHIVGLDRRMSGGIPKGHIVLVSGMPGTMKSSVCYNILYKNARESSNRGLYVSLEQSRESISEHMSGLGFNHSEVEDLVTIVDLGYLRSSLDLEGEQDWMSVFKMYVENLKASSAYDILVIDSLPVLEMLADVQRRRLELFHLFNWLRGLGITTFIIAEATTDLNVVHDEDFLADGIIHLRTEKYGSKANLFLGITKMREARHDRDYFPLIVENGVFEIVSD
ncbi:MAG: ATPase domain-containing protein [Candidatus Thermoplasmatota archaeon]